MIQHCRSGPGVKMTITIQITDNGCGCETRWNLTISYIKKIILYFLWFKRFVSVLFLFFVFINNQLT